MLYPQLDKLMEKVDSKYALVIATAKRARSIADDEIKVKYNSKKPVTIAANEIGDGTILLRQSSDMR